MKDIEDKIRVFAARSIEQGARALRTLDPDCEHKYLRIANATITCLTCGLDMAHEVRKLLRASTPPEL